MTGTAQYIEAMLDRLAVAVQWLALPISLLLFLQWPLREWVQGWSREANDLGQILFAFYVAAAVAITSRRGAHLAASGLAQGYAPRTRRLLSAVASLGAVMPWALFVLYATRAPVMNSVLAAERFAETGNPGYFLIKLAIWALALLLLAAAALDVLRATVSEVGGGPS